MSNTRYANTLARTRKQHGLSQRYVAQLIGHSHQQGMSRYERGECPPNLSTAAALSAVYGVSVEELFPVPFAQARTAVQRQQQTLERKRKHYVSKPNTTTILGLYLETSKIGVAVFSTPVPHRGSRPQMARQARTVGHRQTGRAACPIPA